MAALEADILAPRWEEEAPPRRRRWTSAELWTLQSWGLLGDRGGYELLDGDLWEKGGARRRAWTAPEIARMVERGFFEGGAPYELIDGDLVEMSPQGPLHVRAKARLTIWLAQNLPPHLSLVPDAPLRLAEKQEPEPDIFLHLKTLDPKDVRGSDTLLVVEVADSSLAYDRKVKARIYAEHRVPLYWIVDERRWRTLVHRLDGARYGAPERVSFDAPLAVPEFAEAVVLADLLT